MSLFKPNISQSSVVKQHSLSNKVYVSTCLKIMCYKMQLNYENTVETILSLWKLFLNQVRAWFLEITSVWMYACVCACACVDVCVSAPQAIQVKRSLNNQSNKSYCFSVSLYGNCYRYNQWAWP